MLDIEDAAPRPGRASGLVLRRADPRRASTQAWRLVPPGRMACAHNNLCVQPDGLSLMALTPGTFTLLIHFLDIYKLFKEVSFGCYTFLTHYIGTRVVLGLPASGRSGWSRGSPVPPEQAVSWHTLRPGSGRLEVTLTADGPTRLVKIRDLKDPVSLNINKIKL